MRPRRSGWYGLFRFQELKAVLKAVDNAGGRVFAAVYGNDSVEVIDTARGKRSHSLQDGFS